MKTSDNLGKDQTQRDAASHDTVMATDISAELRHVLDLLPDGVLFLDREWRLTYANQTARKISRIRPEDLHSKTHWELYPATVGTEQERKYRRVMDERVVEELDFFYAPFDIWIHLRAFPIESGIAVYYEDVTERRRMEQSAASLTRRLEQVFDVTTDAIVSLNREWQFTFLNRRAKDLLGLQEDLLGKSLWHEFPDAVYPGSPFVENYYKTMVSRVPTQFDAFYPAPLNKLLRLDCQPSEEGIVVFFRDITQRRKDEERYRLLTELSPQAIWTATPSGEIDFVNHRFTQYAGTGFGNGGRSWLEIFDAADQQRISESWRRSLRSGDDFMEDARILRHEDGMLRWWHLRASPMRTDTGEIHGWLGTALDIHERKAASEMLRAQQAETERQRKELEAVYRTAPVGLALFEPTELRYLRVNDRQSEVLGMPPEQILGQRIEDIVVSPEVPRLFREHVLRGETIRDHLYETELRSRPGDVRSFNVNYSPIFDEDGTVRAISAAVLEVTQLRRAERALLQSEKLAAVGRLASSISHEINNPLEAVTNLLYLVATDTRLATDTRSYVRMAQDELVRVSQIATQTLRFHRQAVKPTRVTPAQLVDAVLNLYQGRLANSGIHVEAAYSTVQPVLCFENDIRQVLNNLIANAIDAMRTGGRLLVRAHDAERGGVRGVRFLVADNGTGMSAETQARLFEPFYTTKDLNGNGLGLWISKQIVERHDGEMKVRSKQEPPGARGAASNAETGSPGMHGSVFSLFLPCDEKHEPERL